MRNTIKHKKLSFSLQTVRVVDAHELARIAGASRLERARRS
ncbi:MAG TPA: hypothetical protein VL463_09285 [Kofleriaceae bacterium]|jgi:hypothetical protein|nr:hypothetical protein [Kofleriaceae bacterium]